MWQFVETRLLAAIIMTLIHPLRACHVYCAWRLQSPGHIPIRADPPAITVSDLAFCRRYGPLLWHYRLGIRALFYLILLPLLTSPNFVPLHSDVPGPTPVLGSTVNTPGRRNSLRCAISRTEVGYLSAHASSASVVFTGASEKRQWSSRGRGVGAEGWREKRRRGAGVWGGVASCGVVSLSDEKKFGGKD